MTVRKKCDIQSSIRRSGILIKAEMSLFNICDTRSHSTQLSFCSLCVIKENWKCFNTEGKVTNDKTWFYYEDLSVARNVGCYWWSQGHCFRVARVFLSGCYGIVWLSGWLLRCLNQSTRKFLILWSQLVTQIPPAMSLSVLSDVHFIICLMERCAWSFLSSFTLNVNTVYH